MHKLEQEHEGGLPLAKRRSKSGENVRGRLTEEAGIKAKRGGKDATSLPIATERTYTYLTYFNDVVSLWNAK